MLSTNQHNNLPLTFPVDVLGVQQRAAVLDYIWDRSCFRAKVRFEDGFEDIFTITDGPQISIEGTQNGIEHYANALLQDLYILTNIEPGIFFYTLPMELNCEPINVWIVEEEPTPEDIECVTVSYQQGLQFELYRRESGGWQYRELKRPLTFSEKEIAIELAGSIESIRQAVTINLE